MTSDVLQPVSLWRAARARGRVCVLLFDYDGTLVPLAQHPKLALPSSRVLEILNRLAQLPIVYLGILSGRQLRELRAMLPQRNFFLAGTSGLEVDFRGISVTHPLAGSMLPLLQQVGDKLHALSQRFRGAWLERKRVGLTLHFRGVAAMDVGPLLRGAAEILGPHSCRLKVFEGPLAVEIMPNLGWTKGTAIRMILESLRIATPLVFYAGDGANDEDAMQFVEKLGGITVGIGDNAPSSARFFLSTPADLLDFLSELEIELSAGVPKIL